MNTRNPQTDRSLSVRLRQSCRALNIDTEEKLETALASGALHTRRNVGQATIDEALAWLKARTFDGMESSVVYQAGFIDAGYTGVDKQWIKAPSGEALAAGQCLVLDPNQWPVGTVVEIHVPYKSKGQ